MEFNNIDNYIHRFLSFSDCALSTKLPITTVLNLQQERCVENEYPSQPKEFLPVDQHMQSRGNLEDNERYCFEKFPSEELDERPVYNEKILQTYRNKSDVHSRNIITTQDISHSHRDETLYCGPVSNESVGSSLIMSSSFPKGAMLSEHSSLRPFGIASVALPSSSHSALITEESLPRRDRTNHEALRLLHNRYGAASSENMYCYDHSSKISRNESIDSALSDFEEKNIFRANDETMIENCVLECVPIQKMNSKGSEMYNKKISRTVFSHQMLCNNLMKNSLSDISDNDKCKVSKLTLTETNCLREPMSISTKAERHTENQGVSETIGDNGNKSHSFYISGDSLSSEFPSNAARSIPTSSFAIPTHSGDELSFCVNQKINDDYKNLGKIFPDDMGSLIDFDYKVDRQQSTDTLFDSTDKTKNSPDQYFLDVFKDINGDHGTHNYLRDSSGISQSLKDYLELHEVSTIPSNLVSCTPDGSRSTTGGLVEPSATALLRMEAREQLHYNDA